MAIQLQNLLPLLVSRLPGFRKHLAVEVDDWLTEEGEISPCAVFRLAGDLVVRRFEQGDFDGADRVFEAVELCLAEGTDEVGTAAATCFLELVVNKSEVGALAVHFMGPLSKQHCRAWDKFTGVATPGLDSSGAGA